MRSQGTNYPYFHSAISEYAVFPLQLVRNRKIQIFF